MESEGNGQHPEQPNTIPLSMYEIPGQPAITKHSYERYMRAKKQDSQIRTMPSTLHVDSPFKKEVQGTPKIERPALIERRLTSSDRVERDEAAGLIKLAPVENVASLVSQGLAQQIPEASWQITYVPTKEKKDLIETALNSPNLSIKKIAAALIATTPQSDRNKLRRIVQIQIEQGIQSPDIDSMVFGSSLIRFAPSQSAPEHRTRVLTKFQEILKGTDAVTIRNSLELLKYVPDEAKEVLFEQIVKMGLGTELVTPQLYRGQNITSEAFARSGQEKTGSDTTLLGGSLLGKSIIRHIQPDAFLAWQKAFEDYSSWQKAGFNYTPVEPIQTYRTSQNGTVNVFSGVLDTNLEDWSDKSNRFAADLKTKKTKILNTLQSIGVSQNHDHDQNFCLRFYRDPNGNIDFSRTPNLYIIDFDQAYAFQT